MNIPEDILSELKLIARTQPLITLLNYYQGVPVSYAASLQRFDLNSATFDVHKYQAVCLALDKQTQLRSKVLSLAVQATVLTVDVAAGTARLTDFRPVAYTPERRLPVKSDPNQPVEVELVAQNWTVHGRLKDISLVRLGVYLPASEIYFEPEIVFQENLRLQLRLRLPGVEQPLDLAGIIARGSPQDNDYTLDIRLPTDVEEHKLIQDYILRRQATAVQELQTVYERMTQTPAGQNASPAS